MSPEDRKIRIERLADELPEQIEAASAAALRARMTLTDLCQLRDTELFDVGNEAGSDALAELSEAGRSLRNARRIAEARAALLADEVSR